jgi:hypothetical protein
MFSKPILVAFLSLALFAQAIPRGDEQLVGCNAQAQTVTQVATVTVTASSANPTDKTLLHGSDPSTGVNGGRIINSGNNNSGSATSAAAAASSTSSAAASSSSSSSGKNSNPQNSLTLDPNVIAVGFANNGQNVTEAGQVPSLTSTNNFINFCLTAPNLPITNGKQITTGSCNPAPMGLIPSTANMPSAKFVFPTNFATVKANTSFTIQMAISNLQTGFFVNAQENYFAAPQQLNKQGQIQGHSHVVVESLSALDQTTPTNPKVFAFFKGLNAAATNGVLTADVTNGLAPGVYKVSSINTAANHQPVLVPIAQHGSLDDAVYFSVTADGKAPPSAAPTASSVASAPAKAATPPAKAAPPTKSASPPIPSVAPFNGKNALQGGVRGRRFLNRMA